MDCIALQGIHTMLPISWPVSVVLALFMTAIHIVYRIGTSPDYACNLPMVSFLFALPNSFAMSWDYTFAAKVENKWAEKLLRLLWFTQFIED